MSEAAGAPRADVGRVVLASGSPRRRELLAALGLPFEVRPSDVDESAEEPDPVRLAEGLALRKARATVAAAADDGALAAEAVGDVVIGADTVVALDGRMLAKPADAAEAREMLEALRGRGHLVVTGVAVIAGGRSAADHAATEVVMRAYGDDEIERYIATGSPMDKAGAYAIQDRDFAPVEAFEGCECSVVGLPLWTLRRLLRVVASIDTPPPDLERCEGCPAAPAGGAR